MLTERVNVMWGIYLLVVLVVIAGILAFAGFYFYGVAIKRAPKEFLGKTPDLKVDPPVAGASWGKGRNGWHGRTSGKWSWSRKMD